MNNNEELEKLNDNELIMLYREEDEDAKNLLYNKYRFIIDILIKKYLGMLSTLNVDYQDIYSECALGFSDGLRSFQDDKETSLATFITLCVERRINAMIRKYNRDKHKSFQNAYSLEFIYNDENDPLINLISDDCNHDPLKNMMEEEEYKDLIQRIENALTKQEYEVFILKAKGFNYLEIAKILHKSPKQVDNTIQRLKMKIKKIVQEKVEI